jgi:hypothetical protein
MKQKKKTIDFTKVDWANMDYAKLQFFFKEVAEFNDSLLEDINHLNNKGFQLLALALTAISVSVGFLLTLLQNKPANIIGALATACVGLGVVTILLFLAIFPRSVYRGKATPHIFFSGTLYKCPMPKILADGIASYHKYIAGNYKVMRYRSRFLTAAIIAFILVPLVIIGGLLYHHLHP